MDFGLRPWRTLLPATTPCSGIKAPLPPGSHGASVHELRLPTPKIKARSQLLLWLSPPRFELLASVPKPSVAREARQAPSGAF